MITRIAHISDVHCERCDVDMRDRLGEALVRERPDLLVVTGDLVDHPWSIRRGRDWLLAVCRQTGVDPEKNLVVVPGNHDYRVFGTFGLSPLTGLAFRRAFPQWRRERITLHRDRNLTFFRFDSNPLVRGFARGRVSERQLAALRATLASMDHSAREDIARSVKIAVLHHHPLPVPHEGRDTFLGFRDAQNFVKFLAENRIEVVLHGHKHRAPHSLLRLGTCGGQDRVVEFVGAGTVAARETDREARGYNFNLLTIEDSGLRYVRQFFARPKEPFVELQPQYCPEAVIEAAYARRLSYACSYDHVVLELDIDDDGDARSLLSHVGLRAPAGGSLDSVQLPPFSVDCGHLSSARLDADRSSPGVRLKPSSPSPQEMQFEVEFSPPVTANQPADFCLDSYDLNVFSMSVGEYRRKHQDYEAPEDFIEKRIDDAVGRLTVAVRFPPGMRFAEEPSFQVLDYPAEKRHPWLTEALQSCFCYSAVLRAATLNVMKPPAGFGYRILWKYGAAPPVRGGPELTVQMKASRFVTRLLPVQAAFSKGDVSDQATWQSGAWLCRCLAAFAGLIRGKVEEKVGVGSGLDPQSLDMSLMVCDEFCEGATLQLRVVAATSVQQTGYRDFSLRIGDGLAGRAYKRRQVRRFDPKEAPDDPKNQAYIGVPGLSQHALLYSVPLTSPDAPDVVFAVVSIGTFAAVQARLLRSLADQEGECWLAEAGRTYLLPRLLEWGAAAGDGAAAGLTTGLRPPELYQRGVQLEPGPGATGFAAAVLRRLLSAMGEPSPPRAEARAAGPG